MSEGQNHSTSAVCVGQAKSGTASLCGLLKNHRAVHEPERSLTLELILKESRGEVRERAVRDYIVQRNRRLKIAYDIAWANQFLISHFLAAFPGVRFIVLIRDPYTWLQSIVGHLITREVPPDVIAFLDWWFRPDRYPHGPDDRALKERGLFSVAAFLHAWKDHIDSCDRLIPPEKRLTLRAHELDASHERLATFLSIPVESIDSSKGHSNRGSWSAGLESLIDSQYLNDTVSEICGEKMERYFPDIVDRS